MWWHAVKEEYNDEGAGVTSEQPSMPNKPKCATKTQANSMDTYLSIFSDALIVRIHFFFI